ncbi:MAG: hypothetical protein RL490_1169 [Pseudomonadota bacterium]|jgi:hypothetical protein
MDIETFIGNWHGKPGGAERANFPIFISEFCRALGLPEPGQAIGGILSDYQYEAPVRPDAAFSAKASGRIDLYKRGCFVLEAKQSRLGEIGPAVEVATPAPVIEKNLFGESIVVDSVAKARAAPRRYDRLMEDALAQAKGYALALPPEHGWPPFLIVCDVGRAFELHFDWAGNGKGYGFFPDQKSYRIELADLRRLSVQALLRGVWTDPASVDPRRRAIVVTREIAGRLARVSARLEADIRKDQPDADAWALALGIEESSLFLMRILFCMFAEDVELLPLGKFEAFLESARTRSDRYWVDGLTDLWSRMGDDRISDRWWSFGDAIVRHFNGNLFHAFRVLKVPVEEKGELLAAAKCDWKSVEPAIFGTLLEQALTDGEREKLGAHYTPRAYVERLVDWTVMDVLRDEWDAVRNPVAPAGEDAAAAAPTLAAAHAFHARLAELKILDPACGTGNFLYVAMEQLLRLESDVLVLIGQLGGEAKPLVGPNQFLGLELNPRAAVIAELVLWIGWLRFRLANDPDSIGEPVLPPLHNINFGRHGGYDALLAGNPVTGETADLARPRPAAWPDADFIIGNPPFIGGKDLRAKLGSEYKEALAKAAPEIPESADLVMQWWHRAARLAAQGSGLRRFGFVTTNSITQSFSRRVVAAHLNPASGQGKISLIMAIADHPWYVLPKAETPARGKAGKRTGKGAGKAPTTAAVRIAMSVAQAGDHAGTAITITSEAGIDTDRPDLGEALAVGRINADLTVGTDVTAAKPLKANDGICHDGVKLHGKGFRIKPNEAAALGLGGRPGLEAYVRPYRNGRDLAQTPRGYLVIDLFGLSEVEVRTQFPEIYQHLLKTVKPERDVNNRATYRENWWIFGEPRREMRPALAGLTRYIVTVDTAAHRVFQFLAPDIICDDKAVIVASQDAFHLGVLSSRLHVEWSLRTGGWLGFGNDSVYVKSRCFDPFPFPDATPDQRATIAALAEELDLTRRAALAENPELTMTGLYNLVEKLRGAATLTPENEAAATRARARIMAKLHADIDAAVAAAYGWPVDLPAADIVTRLVALNAERAAEEAAGQVRWLRPDYQAPDS